MMRLPLYLYRRIFVPALLCLSALAAHADLAAYLAKPEPAYHWEKRAERKTDSATVYDLHLTSQTWQGIVWEHRLVLVIPDKPLFPHQCTLLNTGGNGGEQDIALGIAAANATGGPFAALFNIPNQPLYGGKTEDALVVYTWQKFLETGDESWPLHFPMAKAVLKAMDALQAFTREASLPSLDQFIITGASKRGWTTWLVGASRDPRVKGIAPMVIDTLNLPVQMPHQLAAYGKPSEQVGDYTNAGMLEALNTEKGKRLIALEDPYSYRAALTLPKLIVLGTNDRYWSQDSLNLYWDGLKGPKWILYTPNAGHSLGTVADHLRLLETVGAFARSIASKSSLPKPTWRYVKTGAGVYLTVTSDVPIVSAALWQTHADTQDFRDSKWTSEPISVDAKGFQAHIAAPMAGYAAVYADLTYTVAGQTFHLTTQIEIVPAERK